MIWLIGTIDYYWQARTVCQTVQSFNVVKLARTNLNTSIFCSFSTDWPWTLAPLISRISSPTWSVPASTTDPSTAIYSSGDKTRALVTHAGSTATLPGKPSLASSLSIPFTTIPPCPSTGEKWRWRKRSGREVHSMRGNWCRASVVRRPSCHQPVLKTSTRNHPFFNHQHTPEGTLEGTSLRFMSTLRCQYPALVAHSY